MALDTPISVRVPDAFCNETEGVVARWHVAQGDSVAVGDVLVQIRAGHVEVDIESPLGGTVARLLVEAGDAIRVGAPVIEISLEPDSTSDGPPARTRSASAMTLSEKAPTLLAVAIGAVAFVWPIAWLAMALATTIIVGSVARVDARTGAHGSADSIVVPARLLAAAGRWAWSSIAAVEPLFTSIFRLLWWGALAVLVSAVLGTSTWLVAHGTDGLLAALRLGVFTHAVPVFAFVSSVGFLRRALAHPPLQTRIRTVAAGLPEIALTILAVTGTAWLVVCAVVLPSKVWWPAPSFRAVVHALPEPLRDEVEGWRASIAEAEAHAVIRCVTEHRRGLWREPQVLVRDDGFLTVKVRADRGHPPRARSVSVLMLSLQNQLAPHGISIAIVLAETGKRVEFPGQTTSRPHTSLNRILDRLTAPADPEKSLSLREDFKDRDIDIALECSAAAV